MSLIFDTTDLYYFYYNLLPRQLTHYVCLCYHPQNEFKFIITYNIRNPFEISWAYQYTSINLFLRVFV